MMFDIYSESFWIYVFCIFVKFIFVVSFYFSLKSLFRMLDFSSVKHLKLLTVFFFFISYILSIFWWLVSHFFLLNIFFFWILFLETKQEVLPFVIHVYWCLIIFFLIKMIFFILFFILRLVDAFHVTQYLNFVIFMP